MDASTAANWLTAISIAITAFFAVRALRTWRTEMVGRRRFEVAEEAITVFSQCKMVIEEARTGLTYLGEAADLMDSDQVVPEVRDRVDSYYAVLGRLQGGKEFFAKLITAQIAVRIHLSQGAHDALHVLWKQRAKVMSGARSLVRLHSREEPPRNTEHLRKMEALIWATGESDDEVQRALDEAEKTLIALCEPFLGDTKTGSVGL